MGQVHPHQCVEGHQRNMDEVGPCCWCPRCCPVRIIEKHTNFHCFSNTHPVTRLFSKFLDFIDIWSGFCQMYWLPLEQAGELWRWGWADWLGAAPIWRGWCQRPGSPCPPVHYAGQPTDKHTQGYLAVYWHFYWPWLSTLSWCSEIWEYRQPSLPAWTRLSSVLLWLRVLPLKH